MNEQELFGTDVKLDVYGDFIQAVDGDLKTVSGLNCLEQEIRHRLLTYQGDLFCHADYGAGLQNFIHLEATRINRLDLVQAIKEALLEEPRVVIDSLEVEIEAWSDDKIVALVQYLPIESDVEQNLVLNINREGIEVN